MRNVSFAIALVTVTLSATAPGFAMSKDAAVAECRAVYGPALKRGDADANAKFSACVKEKMRSK